MDKIASAVRGMTSEDKELQARSLSVLMDLLRVKQNSKIQKGLVKIICAKSSDEMNQIVQELRAELGMA